MLNFKILILALNLKSVTCIYVQFCGRIILNQPCKTLETQQLSILNLAAELRDNVQIS